jgi:hypothetical protein
LSWIITAPVVGDATILFVPVTDETAPAGIDWVLKVPSALTTAIRVPEPAKSVTFNVPADPIVMYGEAHDPPVLRLNESSPDVLSINAHLFEVDVLNPKPGKVPS